MTDEMRSKLEGALWLTKKYVREYSDSLLWQSEGNPARHFNEVELEGKYNDAVYLERMLDGDTKGIPKWWLEDLFKDIPEWDSFFKDDGEDL